jgi:hypothetical protein
MGIDPGKGLTYEAPMHVNYYAQWAAHNTVVSGGVSASVPYFKGGGGTKKMGQIELQAMEPRADKKAVSPYCSFTDTRYIDISTNTPQQRTLAIIRTSETAGYYIDIYRSANTTSNEYVYHNIGNDVTFLSAGRKPIPVKPTPFPISKQPFDPPGFRNIQDYQSIGTTNSEVIALFSLKENAAKPRFMQVMFAGESGREFYSGIGPQSGTADIPYRTMPTPTLVARQEGEAWKRPFIAVYEPYIGDNNYMVEKIENIDQSAPGDFSAVKVFSIDGTQQIILQSVKAEESYEKDNWKFTGSFGVINIDKNELKYLYLGEGKEISYGKFSIVSNQPVGSANVIINGNTLTATCNQETTITIKGSTSKTLTLTEAGKNSQLPVLKTKDGISFTIPVVSNGEIKIL